MRLNKNKTYSLKDYQKREVNLLPSNFHRANRIKFGFLMFVAFCVVCVGAFAYYEYSYYQETKDIIHQTKVKREAIADNQKIINNQNIVFSIEQRIAKKEVLLAYIYYSNRSLSDIIDTIESSLNGEVYFTSFKADSSTSVVISASALSHEAISHTINKLKLITNDDNSKYFTDVYTNGIVRNEDENGNILYLFQLECKFEGGVFNEIK